jgi:hypothetical protein
MPPKYEVKDTTNEAGYRVRVQVPTGKPVSRGIPISVDFEALAEAFQLKTEDAQTLQRMVWASGIITPRDFRRGEAYEALYSAVRSVYPGLERKHAAKLGTDIVQRVRDNQ